MLTWIYGQKTRSRERAVQFLFQHDLNRPATSTRRWTSSGNRSVLPPLRAKKARRRGDSRSNCTAHRRGNRDGACCRPLIRGTLEHRDEIDGQIKNHVKNWNFTASLLWIATSCGWRFTKCYTATTSRPSSASTRPWISPKNSPLKTAVNSSMASWTRSKAN